MPVGPETIEFRPGVYWATHVSVVVGAVVCQLFFECPVSASIFAGPHGDLSAGIVRLSARFGRGNDVEFCIRFQIQGAHVVVVVGLSNVTDLPIATRPATGRFENPQVNMISH